MNTIAQNIAAQNLSFFDLIRTVDRATNGESSDSNGFSQYCFRDDSVIAIKMSTREIEVR